MRQQFVVGDIVRISKKSFYYGEGSDNPKDIDGKVFEVTNEGLPVNVKWDNDEDNRYGHDDLKLRRKG